MNDRFLDGSDAAKRRWRDAAAEELGSSPPRVLLCLRMSGFFRTLSWRFFGFSRCFDVN